MTLSPGGASALTGADGSYQFTGLAPGSYSLTAAAPGFAFAPPTLAATVPAWGSSDYDSLYVVLAQLLNVELWTADQRLLQMIGAAAPWVRFIGDYPLT